MSPGDRGRRNHCDQMATVTGCFNGLYMRGWGVQRMGGEDGIPQDLAVVLGLFVAIYAFGTLTGQTGGGAMPSTICSMPLKSPSSVSRPTQATPPLSPSR